MTAVIECKNICKQYGDKTILKDINLKINSGEKIGIVGCNGAGKTTIANIISGNLSADSGKVVLRNPYDSIGYMKQVNDYKNYMLSGGEKTKKRIKEILYNRYEVLILDEPTNHLDYNSVEWLINKISKYDGTVIIISHDRYFLDKTVGKIVEIENGAAVSFNGNYSYYRNVKKENFENILKLYNNQEKMKKRINMQIDNLKGWSDKAHKEARKKAIATGNKFGGKEHNRAKAKKMDKQIKSRIKRLEKIDIKGIDKPEEEKNVYFDINKSGKTNSVIVLAENISKSFDKKILFENSSFYIKHKEKIGVYGPNGCGKTTLIKALLQSIKIEGTLNVSASAKIGYVNQDVIDFDKSINILQFFDLKSAEESADMRTKLNLLGFDKNTLFKCVSVLSAGEKMKLKLLLMIKEKADVLILDEPTNHIDLHVREQLEDILRQFDGTIILVTHDRYMMNAVCDKLLVFKDKKICRYEYGLSEYLECEKNLKDKNNNLDSEQQLLRKNRLAYVISEMSIVKKDSEEYRKLADEYVKIIGEI